MRAFIALELPDEIKRQIWDTACSLQSTGQRYLKWVEPENLHITFQFLGDISNSHLEDIAQIIQENITELPDLIFENPHLQLINPHNPRILWISYSCLTPELMNAHRRIVKFISQIGYRLDRKPLKYHATLARIKGKLSQQFIDAVLSHQLPQAGFKINRITLFESILKPQGPRYNPRFFIDL